MKRVQMLSALMWTVYGFLIGASPVVVANLLVLAAAACPSFPSPDLDEAPEKLPRRNPDRAHVRHPVVRTGLPA